MAETFNTESELESNLREQCNARTRGSVEFSPPGSLSCLHISPQFFLLTSGPAFSEENSESSIVSGRMEALSRATTANRPLFWEKNTGRLAQQPPPRTRSPGQTDERTSDRDGQCYFIMSLFDFTCFLSNFFYFKQKRKLIFFQFLPSKKKFSLCTFFMIHKI